MEYIDRFAEEKFRLLNNMFQAVLVCGPRQVGKTTMLKHISGDNNRPYVTLDDLDDRALALKDPKMFFQKYKPPIIIDEIQFAPNLFSYIKIMADNHQKNGEFWLTGSQSYKVMRLASESLAGRIGIINMYSLTHQELTHNLEDLPTDFSFDTLNRLTNRPSLELNDVFSYIFKGGMPKCIGYTDEMRAEYFKSYIDTYLMKDIMELGKITDAVRFKTFLTACASQNTQVVNYANLALASDVSQPTAKEWLSLLQGIGIVYLVQPYFSNALKRLTKTPKLYFYDTGLCAYLAKIPSKDMLMSSSFNGAYFENFVMNQLMIKNQLSSHERNIYFYRDIDKNEVDILLEDGEGIVPLEVKLSANPNKRGIEKFKVLEKLNRKIKDGGIVCLIDSVYPISEQHSLIPVGLI